ncbi:MAG: glycosyl hydrolase 53 family protein [Chlorobia bacterium]|nr:glycosyl hydrolase 53 family protein [Fimbriimonadaceae bacterium]
MTKLFLAITFFATTLMPADTKKPMATPFLSGGDVSEIPEVEAGGGKYFYKGKHEDPFVLMKKAGWNFVRFRIWNQPRGGWCDKDQTLKLAKRAHAQGIEVSLDFHYSDWWADPGKQNKPAAWKDLSFADLEKAVYDYTKDVVSAMIAQGTPPYMVQVGNEILGGMLWPEGKASSNDPEQWRRLAKLLNSGIKAVKDAQGKHKILTMIHLDRGGDNKTAVWWFDHLHAQKVQYDTIGLSFYPWWHGSLADFEKNVNDLATRYKKDIYIVEVAYPWGKDERPGPHVYNGDKVEPGYPQTPDGQAKFLAKVIEIIKKMPDSRGKGILYWAPTWIPSPKEHSPYTNLATFDEKGLALPSVDVLGVKN